MHFPSLHSHESESSQTGHVQQQAQAPTNPLTVIELFQSQGCSSCPPTNSHVISLATDPALLVLTYEVTYWDHLGWTDTFGNREFDDRQRSYARALGSRSVYTPQVIVDGLVDGVGNTESQLRKLMERGRQLSKEQNNVEVLIYEDLEGQSHLAIEAPKALRARINLVRFEETEQEVSIGRGENRGRILPHRNVVRQLYRLDSLFAGGRKEYHLPSADQRDQTLKTAILVQHEETGAILGAAKL